MTRPFAYRAAAAADSAGAFGRPVGEAFLQMRAFFVPLSTARRLAHRDRRFIGPRV